MRTRWIHRLFNLTLLALLLTVQAANAAHEVKHQSIDHTEVCLAFVTADHASAIELASLQIPRVEPNGSRLELPPVSVRHAKYFSTCARAPPSL